MTSEVTNPALPPERKTKTLPSRYRPPPKSIVTNTRGVGASRIYLDVQAKPSDVAYPPRPVPGSVADLDVVMQHCDFSLNKVCFNNSLVLIWKFILPLSMYGTV